MTNNERISKLDDIILSNTYTIKDISIIFNLSVRTIRTKIKKLKLQPIDSAKINGSNAFSYLYSGYNVVKIIEEYKI